MASSHLEPHAELRARLDVAAICWSLMVSIGGATRSDIYLFGYLAAMTSSQTGKSPSKWGYTFAATREGLPFSDALDYVTDQMIASGELEEVDDGFRLSDRFAARFGGVLNSTSFGERLSLVQDVCNVVVFRALPGIGRAVQGEPQLNRSAEVGSVRIIDEQELARTLMVLMLKVRDRLPEDYPPSSPAMLWLDEWEQRVDL